MRIETFTRDQLGRALANRVATDLRTALAERDRASLAVPGGTTPGPFLTALAAEDLDWSKITVTLTDERQVPSDSARSNARLVRETLIDGGASAAQFVTLWEEGEAEAAVEARVAQTVLPLDACVLGMGGDMHTASLFPGTPGLAALLDPGGARAVAFVAPPGADEDRVTLTCSALISATEVYILITGQEKRTVLTQTATIDDHTKAPIRAILDGARSVTVFYAD
jgi:6-phosphogluconolactonase